MPNMDNGRQKVLDYLKDNNLTMATLAVQYNMARQDVTNILNGKLKNPQAHRFVARVIEDFKIRQKGTNMKPERYPYSGARKKPIKSSIDFVIDQNAILQLVVLNSPLKRPESDL